MKQFLLLLHDDLEKMANLSSSEMNELVNAHVEWAKSLAKSGNLISGDGLQEKCILIKGKEAIIKDGPYIESKEMIGGYYLLQAENIDTIVEIAKNCPCHIWGGITEIRPIMDMEGYEQLNN